MHCAYVVEASVSHRPPVSQLRRALEGLRDQLGDGAQML